MKRSEMFEKVEVICLTCPKDENTRILNKSSLKKEVLDVGPPYCKKCSHCSRQGKKKTEAHKKSLSKSLVNRKQSEEVIQRKREYMKAHPELWKKNIRTKGCKFKHSEETKKKIGKGIKKERGKNNES